MKECRTTNSYLILFTSLIRLNELSSDADRNVLSCCSTRQMRLNPGIDFLPLVAHSPAVLVGRLAVGWSRIFGSLSRATNLNPPSRETVSTFCLSH